MYAADECEGGGVRKMLGLGVCSRGNGLFCCSFHESRAAWGGVGSLSGFEHEGIYALAPRFAHAIEVFTSVCGSGE